MRRTFSLALLASLFLSILAMAPSSAAMTSTTTVIQAPNQFGVDSNMPIRVQVTSDEGAAAPTGNISLYNSFGAFVATLPLTPTDNGRYSWVETTWSANTLGRNGLKAVYISDSADFESSQSTFAGIQIFTQTPLAVLKMPDRFVVGVQADLVLIITPANGGGSATFSANNSLIYPSTPNRTGQISFPWTPTESIPYTLVSNYTNAAGNASHQMRQAIFANPS